MNKVMLIGNVGTEPDVHYFEADQAVAKLHLSDADLIAYSHGRYYGLGDFIGKFGYSVQKPSKPKSSRKKK